MAKVICISNQKGGVTKTTTTQAVATILNSQGKKTLMVDMDPQGNLSFALGADNEEKPTVYNVLKNEVNARDVIQKTPSGDLIPANILLSAADMEFTSTGREYLLKEAISEVKEDYQYVVIDTPPALNILTVNAFSASDFIVIPMLADVFSLQGMGQLSNTIESVIKYCNEDLKVAGILMTKYNARTNLSAHIKKTLEQVAKQFHSVLFKTVIRNSIALQEAQLQQLNFIDYDTKNNALNDYVHFVKELEGIVNG